MAMSLLLVRGIVRVALLVAVLQVISALSLASAPIAPRSLSTTRLGFGSCNRVEKEQPLWPSISSAGLDAWIWGGDAIYADTKHPCVKVLTHRNMEELGACAGRLRDRVLGRTRPRAMVRENTHFTPARPKRIERLYRAQLAHRGYAAFVEELRRGDERGDPSRIVGTWDDHDFGIDDGDRTYAFKVESREAFARFIAASGLGLGLGLGGNGGGASTASDILASASESVGEEGEGVYRSVLVGAPPRQVMVVLLDLRYFKEPWSVGSNGTMLGERQERWLERTLRASAAQVHLIVSSLQVLPTQRNFNEQAENWERFPRAREALLSMLLASRAPSPLILSGDVHFAEMSRMTCAPQAFSPGFKAHRRDVYEVTSSGMTHAWGGRSESITPRGFGALPGVGLMRRMITAAFAHMPWRYSFAHYNFVNWLEVEIDWDAALLHARVIGVDGDAKIEQTWSLHNDSESAARFPTLAGHGGSGSGPPLSAQKWSCAPLGGEERGAALHLGVLRTVLSFAGPEIATLLLTLATLAATVLFLQRSRRRVGIRFALISLALIIASLLLPRVSGGNPFADEYADLRRRFGRERRIVTATASSRGVQLFAPPPGRPVLCGDGDAHAQHRVFERFVDEDALNELLGLASTLTFAPGRTVDSLDGSSNARRVAVATLSSAVVASLASTSAKHAVATLLARVAHVARVPTSHIELQLNVYGGGGHYSPHFDTRPSASNPRIATCLLYLSSLDRGDGGETTFPLLNVAMRPARGAALLWHNVATTPAAAEGVATEDFVSRLGCLPPDPRSCRTAALDFFDSDALDAAEREGVSLCSWHAAMPLREGATKAVVNAWVHRDPFRGHGEAAAAGVVAAAADEL